MSNSIVPSQIGYTSPGSDLRSQIYLGRDTFVNFEAIGLGANQRPDALQSLKINISKIVNYGKSDQLIETRGSIYLDIDDIIKIQSSDYYPSTEDGGAENLMLQLKEVSVCEQDKDGNSVEKRMVIIGSQTYDAPTS